MDLAIDQTANRSRWTLAHGLPSWGLRPITDLNQQQSEAARLRWGRIVTENGHLVAISDRWWPYKGNLFRVWWDRKVRGCRQDRCELFFSTALGSSRYMTLDYVRSGAKTKLATLFLASVTLDEIARLRKANAIVCHVTNQRISERLLRRWGWQSHCHQWNGRHFIKRFYGDYPELNGSWRRKLGAEKRNELSSM